MSAIAGIFRFDGAPVERDAVERITAAMAINGQAGSAHWFNGPVVLGHCMLRTTHEAVQEVQPLASDTTDVVLVMDGRLDNREELERDFAARGVALRSRSDAELVLRAYEVWGDACPGRLLGDFAFAVWDARHRRLFCATDHMGASPLYYSHSNDFFAFASTEEALLEVPGVSSEPNEERIASVLVPAFHSYDPASSWLRDVRVLLPGQTLSLTPEGKSTATVYWQWEAGEDTHFASESEAQEEFLSVFSEAVRCRLRSAGTVAQMLSGGIDSASIRAMVTNPNAGKSSPSLRTYSAVSDFPESCPETRCIQSLARGLDASFVAIPSFSGMVGHRDLAHEAWSQAHPVDNSITLPALMCLAARRRGDRVMLHGASGDVTTAVPNRYMAYFMRTGQWKRAWDECRHASVNNNYLRGAAPLSLLALNAWSAFAPASIKSLRNRARRRSVPQGSLAINPEFANRLRIDERVRGGRTGGTAGLANIQEKQAQLLRGPFSPVLGLRGYARLGKRYGMDMRDPWGDKRVVEYFLRLPLAYKTGQGWTKYVVRKSLHAQLEPTVVWRVGKEHLGWQVVQRLMQDSRELVTHSFRTDFDRVAPYLQPELFRACLRRYGDSADTHTSLAHADRERVHDVLVILLWLKRLAQDRKKA